MKKILFVTIALIMPMFMLGQSYSALWKKVSEAERKDLPKTQYEVLQQIVDKAQHERQYGQLLKAELMGAKMLIEIAPDSLKPAMHRIVKRYQSTTDETLRTVYQTVLWQIDQESSNLKLGIAKPELTPELCRLLSKTKDSSLSPFVLLGADAAVFGNDLLSVVGSELGYYQQLRDYYQQAGNKKAVSALDAQLAVEKYNDLTYGVNATTADKIAYIDEAVRKWGQWPVINQLRNARKQLTNPELRATVECPVVRPMQSQMMALNSIRNVQTVALKVYPVSCKGDIELVPSNPESYKRIQPLLGKPVVSETKQLTAHQDYEIFTDSILLQGLPVGVYMIELTTNPATEVLRMFYHVSNIFTIAEAQPDNKVRYVVVDATTGQPIAGAHLTIKEQESYREAKTYEAMTNSQGEYIFATRDLSRSRTVFAYTAEDQASPALTGNNRYEYYEADGIRQQTAIFTDRGIYRPGQTLHASALAYQVVHGTEQTVRAKLPLTFTLRDANHKVVAEKQAETDDYGVAAVDFTLPATGLTGMFSLQVENNTQLFRVEEYKRPTFHVDFDEYKATYQAGDTISVKGTALSYAGVPVQDAKVKYKVVRRMAFWWWSYSRYYENGAFGYGSDGDPIYEGEATTDAEGHFNVMMPLTMPKSERPMFYHFVVTADVTDVAGETHSAQLSLPLGNRETALSIDLNDQVLVEHQPKATLHLRNAAGQDIEAQVDYRIDGGAWLSAKTNTPISIAKLPVGRHELEAKYESETVTRSFIVFSLDDERPVAETADWFYQSAAQFPNDGTPVTIQVGSSAPDVHIVYSIFSGKRLIEQGAVERSNQLINRTLTYQDDYENGLLLTFAWVKDGHCYTHKAQISRPLPNKHLTLEWATFRNRLTPGQQEEWTLSIKDSNGQPVDANLMATLYDQSLDQLTKDRWTFSPYLWVPLPNVSWKYRTVYAFHHYISRPWDWMAGGDIRFSSFDHAVYPINYMVVGYAGSNMKMKTRSAALEVEGVQMLESNSILFDTANEAIAPQAVAKVEASQTEKVQLGERSAEGRLLPEGRKNLDETAFFYPQLTTDMNGRVAIKFTLPESLTTWQLLGFAHTRELYYGNIEAEAVAKKDVMIQPNVPRFIREGDKATITGRIINSGSKAVKGTARLVLINAETNAVVYEQSQKVALAPGETKGVAFELSPLTSSLSPLIARMAISGNGFSDGEQHYLPVLPAAERITVALPITQHQPGTEAIDLSKLVPTDAKDAKLTLEYTNSPVWLMVQALPQVGAPREDNAISLAAALYANGIGQYIIAQNPQIKPVFEQWQQEEQNSQLSALTSQLAKNQELKELILNETPWMLESDNETEQKHRLVDFFDENLMNNRLDKCLEKLQKLQQGDGSWTWYPGMPGSFYMTVAVSEMLVRLNALTMQQTTTKGMLNSAFRFMGSEVVELVKELKKAEEKGDAVNFPSQKALQWLYLVTLDGRQLPAEVLQANSYLLELLKKDIKHQSIYDKALSAVIFSKIDMQRAKDYAQSLKEYTVYREDMGRYYDTQRAGYSWFDYKIPTQSIAIEALQQITPDDEQTIGEMQRWLLQQKRTQAWDTPVNSVNAIYAFLKGNEYRLAQNEKMPAINLDVRTVAVPKASAAIGYVKTVLPKGRRLTIRKTSEGTSWGAVYAQFYQQSRHVTASGSGLTIQREVLGDNLKVGDRVRVRLTITADRDYDFVQVIDKRAACMEPIKQLSGYHHGGYITPRDNATCYFYDMLSKGTHVIETEYYLDRPGTYETGTATVECAYAPEFRAVTKSQTLNIDN